MEPSDRRHRAGPALRVCPLVAHGLLRLLDACPDDASRRALEAEIVSHYGLTETQLSSLSRPADDGPE